MDTESQIANPISLWEKARALSTILASVVIPVVLGFASNWYTSAIKDKETQVKYIELALGLLSQEPTDKNLKIRQWAIDVINHYSDVKISPDAEVELLNEKLKLQEHLIELLENSKKLSELNQRI